MKIGVISRLAAVALLSAVAVSGCDSATEISFPFPDEPLNGTLYDLVAGPIDRPSGLNVVSGRGNGSPNPLRVDASGRWDVAFAELDGVPVLLPRGYFEGLEESSGVRALGRSFDKVTEVTDMADGYETIEPTPLVVGATYAVRSRPDPALSLPCRVYAKLEVLDLEGDPARMQFRILWNPNCDRTNFDQ